MHVLVECYKREIWVTYSTFIFWIMMLGTPSSKLRRAMNFFNS
jgi:hypothetical protein